MHAHTHETKTARDHLAASIRDAHETLDAILNAIDRGDDAALRFATRRQLPTDLGNMAHWIGEHVAGKAN